MNAPGAPLPPEDRTSSPYTGWSRRHWEAVVDRTLAAVRPYASPRHALIDLPGPVSIAGRRSDGLEGFARTFLAAGFRLAHGRDGTLAQWYADGLAAGVDPASPERWPRVTETPQAKVEAASIALALHESRPVLWDALPERVQEQVVSWLAEVVGEPYPACNWLWFQNVVEAFLRSVGGPWSADDIDRNIAVTDGWHLGDGWYTDGYEGRATARNFDWYAGWAMNFYPLWYCRMSGAHADASLWDRYTDRLRRYLEQAQHLYAPDGPPLHQGRSLTYRYACLAPVWAGAVFDASPLPPGRTRRLASGVLRHFGAGGIQPIGWYGAFPAIRQPYSGPGSPYWSSKGFAGLVLAADHPVWAEPELPLVVEERDVTGCLAVPGWLVSGTTADGVIRVVNHGTDHADDETLSADDPGYSRHAYSTHAGPEYDGSLVDSHVALIDPAGHAAHRRPLRPLGVAGRVGVSRYRAHWPIGPPAEETWPPRQPAFRVGPWVTTASVLRGAVEVRLARVDGDDGSAGNGSAQNGVDGGGPWSLRVGGYPIAGPEPPRAEAAGATARARRPDGLTCVVAGLRGLTVASTSTGRGTNAFGEYSAVPQVGSDGPVRPGQVYAAAIVLTAAALPDLPRVTVDPDGAIRIHWPDGEVDDLRLDPSAGAGHTAS